MVDAFTELRLYDLEFCVVLQSCTDTPVSLEINRSTGKLSVKGRYLIVITKPKLIGILQNKAIHTIDGFEVIPLLYDSGQKTSQETILLNILKAHLKSSPLSFSYNYDITRSLQSYAKLQLDEKKLPLWKRADERFFWNHFLQAPLMQYSSTSNGKLIEKFILPVMYGFCEIKQTMLKGHQITLALISRRSRHRAGTRYFSRGLDKLGNVSNFNETEQIIMYKDQLKSYVQIRGSIPLFWAEIKSLRYLPELRILEPLESSMPSISSHFNHLVSLYGPVVCVNLVNLVGHESSVRKCFQDAAQNLKNPMVTYEYFDFHKECGNMRWERVKLLLDRLTLKPENTRWYSLSPTSEQFQTGVIRTNCMDCLDRTNVVQSAIARRILTLQLRELRILNSQENIVDNYDFEILFRSLWADNADIISFAYSGTRALKTDYTRYGVRSRRGALQDLLNSCMRYIKNTYFDGMRQDGFDLVLGHYHASDSQTPLKHISRTLLGQCIPYIIYATFLFLFACLTLPRSPTTNLSMPAIVLMLLAVLNLAIIYIVKNSRSYVQWPTLVPLSYAPQYKSSSFTVNLAMDDLKSRILQFEDTELADNRKRE